MTSYTRKSRRSVAREWPEGLRDLVEQIAGSCSDGSAFAEDWIGAARELHARCLQEMGDACPKCNGSGDYLYGHGSTWRGGMGVCASTYDVCDVCWGTGQQSVKGYDIRAAEAALDVARRGASARWFIQTLGLQYSTVRKYVAPVVDKLRRARWGPIDVGFPEFIQRLATVLEKLTDDAEEEWQEQLERARARKNT